MDDSKIVGFFSHKIAPCYTAKLQFIALYEQINYSINGKYFQLFDNVKRTCALWRVLE